MQVKEAHLFYKDSRSDKVYHISLERSPNFSLLYRVMVKFGPRLGTLTHVDLTKGYANYATANALYEKRLSEKLAKGYQHTVDDERAKLVAQLGADFSLPFFTLAMREKLADFILAYVEERA